MHQGDGLIHLEPSDYHEIRPEDFNAPGLRAFESVGPFAGVGPSGPLVMVHDGRFEPGRGIGHHPHQGMERLFYILEGAVDHDDALNGIKGRMHAGDLGILTEGRRGMIHSEWNHTSGPARAYILVYPNEPLAATASFDVVRDADAERVDEAEGAHTKVLVGRGSGRLRGDVHEVADTALDHGAELAVALGADEGALLYVVDGRVRVGVDGPGAEQGAEAGAEHTVLVPPEPTPRTVRLRASGVSRVLRAVHGRDLETAVA